MVSFVDLEGFLSAAKISSLTWGRYGIYSHDVRRKGKHERTGARGSERTESVED